MAQDNDFPVFAEEKSVYFNAVGLGATAGDIVITLIRNNVPVLTLNACYPVVKSLAEGLTGMLADIEKKSGQEIFSMTELIKKLSAREANETVSNQ